MKTAPSLTMSLVLRLWTTVGSLLEEHRAFVVSGLLSIVATVVLLIGARSAIVRMPADVLRQPQRGVNVMRNVVALLVIAVGILLLFLPGPGLLLIFLGVVLCDLPGRNRALANLLRKPRILSEVNAFRARHNKPPLLPPPCPRG